MNFRPKNTNALGYVNGKGIHHQEVMDAINQKEMGDGKDKEKAKSLYLETFYGRLANLLIEEEAAALGLNVSVDYARDKISRNEKFIDDKGNFSQDLLQKYLQENETNISAYVNKICREIAAHELKEGIKKQVVLPSELKQALKNSFLEKRFGYYKKLDPASYSIDECSDLESFYSQNCHKFADRRVVIEGFLVDVSDMISFDEVGEMSGDISKMKADWEKSLKWKELRKKFSSMTHIFSSDLTIQEIIAKVDVLSSAPSLRIIEQVTFNQKGKDEYDRDIAQIFGIQNDEKDQILKKLFTNSENEKVKQIILSENKMAVFRLKDEIDEFVPPFEEIIYKVQEEYEKQERFKKCWEHGKEIEKTHSISCKDALFPARLTDDSREKMQFLYDELFKMELGEMRALKHEGEVYILHFYDSQMEEEEKLKNELEDFMKKSEENYKQDFLYLYADKLAEEHEVKIEYETLHSFKERFASSIISS